MRGQGDELEAHVDLKPITMAMGYRIFSVVDFAAKPLKSAQSGSNHSIKADCFHSFTASRTVFSLIYTGLAL